ncbi:MAG: DegV family protein [Chloroflexi bacterium]|nr:DegV family protein [Chloroflexota bacterium]
MAQEVGIVTDSISCLTRELVEQYHIVIVPISLYFGDRVYRDWIDISPSEAYQLFLKDPEKFTTSPAAPAHYLEAYREASNRVQNILCITLSSRLSTGFEMARAARDQARAELPGVSIEVLDSQNVTAAQGFIALAAARAAAEGNGMDEVLGAAQYVKARASFVILLDTIRYVYRTGRIPKVAAQLGSVLSLKPMLTISSGLVRFASAVRSRERGIERMLGMLKDKVGESPVHIAVMHAYALEEAEELKKRVASEFNCVELWLTEFSPVMGYATGTGTLGVAFYKEDRP